MIHVIVIVVAMVIIVLLVVLIFPLLFLFLLLKYVGSHQKSSGGKGDILYVILPFLYLFVLVLFSSLSSSLCLALLGLCRQWPGAFGPDEDFVLGMPLVTAVLMGVP